MSARATRQRHTTHMAADDSLLVKLGLQVDALVQARTRRTRGVTDFTRYRTDPVGFAAGVLHVDQLWGAQQAHLRAVADALRVAAYGGNGAGKTFDDAILALWWVYAWDGLVIATSSAERQLKDQFMRDVGKLFHRAPDLGGELHTLSLRRPGQPDAGIICVAAGDPNNLRSYHAPRVLVQLQEAQGLPAFAFESAEIMAVGELDRVTVTGNPTQPAGEFFKRCRSPHWTRVRFNVREHPNVTEGRTVIAGGPTRASIATREADYGHDSAFVQSSVDGEFPTSAIESLFQLAWLERAFALHDAGHLLRSNAPLRLGVDVGRSVGRDPSVVCVARGAWVREFQRFQSDDLEVTSGHVVRIAKALNIHPRARTPDGQSIAILGHALLPVGDPLQLEEHARGARVRVDVIGVGGGVHDRLRGLGYPVEAFNAAGKPRGGKNTDRFVNRRAEAYWHVRDLLEAGKLPLPRQWADELTPELLATNWAPTGAGKVLIESKADIKAKLGGASPDFADSLVMSQAPGGLHFTTDAGGWAP